MSNSEHTLTQKEYRELLMEHNEFEHEIEDLKRRMTGCENQQEAISGLILSVDRLTNTMSSMVEEHKGLKADVKALKEAPAEELKYYKRTIISCLITTVLGAVIGAVISFVVAKGGV